MTRTNFPKDVKRDAYARSGGICECYLIPELGRPEGCGQKLGPGNLFYEHIIQDGIGGKAELDNCACLSKTCWREKTDRHDLPKVSKTKRQRDRAIGIRRSNDSPPMIGSKDSQWKHCLGKRGREAWERRA